MSLLRVVLPLVVISASGCFFKPDAPGGAADANHDGNGSSDAQGSGATPTVRKLADAWYGAGGASAGTNTTGYTISTGNVVDGEIVLFIANVDNGSNATWMLPPNFHQLYQFFYGNDGQTFVAGWKKADHEPTSYSEPYGPNIISGNSTVTLLAVSGADPMTPIENSVYMIGTEQPASPASVPSSGVATTIPDSLLIFAGGVDWEPTDVGSTATFTEPAGFTALEELCDNGGIQFDWSTVMIASKPAPTPGPATAVMGSVGSNPLRVGMPWSVEIALAPAR